MFARRITYLTIIFVATVATLGCDSKKKAEGDSGGAALLRDGADPGHTGFVPVDEAPQTPSEEPAAQTSESEHDESSVHVGDQSIDDVIELDEVRGESVTPSADAAEVERRRTRVKGRGRGGGRGGGPGRLGGGGGLELDESKEDGSPFMLWGGKENDAPEPKVSKPESESAEGDIDLFGGGIFGGPKRKIREANESVENEVTFGSSGSRTAQKEQQRAEQRIERERREAQARKRRQRWREARARQEEALNEELEQQRMPPASTTSTFSMDVDTGSYTLAGRKLARGFVPTPDEVRAEEFINFFEYDYPNPESTFGLTVEGAPDPFRRAKHHYLLSFGIQARALAEAEEKPQHVTILVDGSASMRAPDALPVVQQSIATLAGELDDADTISLIKYGTEQRLLLDRVPVTQTQQIEHSIEMLDAGGASPLADGLEFAFEHASENRSAPSLSNVIVFSDGMANVGPTEGRELAREATSSKAEGVGLTVLGVGADTYNDDLLEQLADRGDGAYYHVNALPEARRLFSERLSAILHTVALDSKIQVEFDPDKVRSFRRIGYENRALPDEYFRRDDVDAAEVGPGQSVTALFEVELEPGATGKLGRLSIRFNEPDGGEEGRELAAAFYRKDIGSTFDDASDDFRFAAAIAGFAEILERTDLGRALDIDQLIAVAESATKGNERRESAVYLMRRLIELAN
jgi:Ca-activated chloride channel family protein